ncbi:hypothetical protein [Streptomyces afghaniensis]|uniref:hypothetical protein n=1 Tax=Streptomyces afghaniensis TaxID=66865 RepID=UPI00277EBB46|nr:hypothetical protein [Streptomyces afghaniensis]MDQ1018895.1 hypothetical protein [Streptomyces afghaniensis]
MDLTTFTEEIELIAGAGDADDALALMRRLLRGGQTAMAIAVRRGVVGGQLDAEALVESGRKFCQQAIEEGEQARRELRKATRDLVRHCGDTPLTRVARELARVI